MFQIYLESLGCDKNTADSEKMLALLEKRGYGLTSELTEADAAIVNTCCFIQAATEESIQAILELAAEKKGRLKYLVAAGCMAQRYRTEMQQEFPEVDAFLGTTALPAVADVLDRLRKGEKNISVYEDISLGFSSDGPVDRVISGHPYMEYLKIAEGCDKRCTYCAIPYFKGHYRSVPMERLLLEAMGLARNGVRELVLVAQETTCYGLDLYGRKMLHVLLQKLSGIDEIQWIRLLYCYPEEIYPEMIEEMRTNPKVLHYIDMPLQHTEDAVLQRMGRRIRKEGIFRVTDALRKAMPDISIRSTMITGFPGETPENHAALLETLEKLKMDHVGAFCYSREENTPAAGFPDQVEEKVKEQYRDDIMALQQDISAEKTGACVGRKMDVIIEGRLPEQGVYTGRTYRDAPEVDGLVFVETDRELMSGRILPVQITGSDAYDLQGVPADE